MRGWGRDIALAARRSLRAPWFSAGLAAVLALGTGANAAIFSLVYTVLLRPLPYERPDEVVMVWQARGTAANWRAHTTIETVLAWRDASKASFSDLAIFKLWDGNREASIDLVLGDRAERLRGGLVTSNFFRVLGVSAALGRVFTPEDEAAGNTDLIVLGDGVWRRAFDADPAIVGRQIVITTGDSRNRRPRPYVVAGVLPPVFKFTYPLDTELWLVDPWAAVEASPRGAIMFNGAVGRLKPGVPFGDAAARMVDVASRSNNASVPVERRTTTRLEPISEWVVSAIRPSLLLLAGTSAILLVIACATVAGALLVRMAERHRELAVRASLGAEPWRLGREAVSEGLVLGLFGTAGGVLLAVVTLPVFRALVPSAVPRADEMGLTLSLFVFAAGIACLVGVLSALVPAFQASRIDVAPALKRASGTASADASTGRLRRGLILLQTAISTALLVACILLAASFWRLGRVDLGFDGREVLTVEMRLREPRYFAPGVMARLQDDMLARIRAIPGVLEAGFTTAVPFRGTDWSMALTRTGEGRRVFANGRMVDASFFSIMKIPLRQGRLFTSADVSGSPRVAIASQAFARQMFGDSSPLGRTFDLDGPVQVVGVVGDVRYVSRDKEPQPAVYLPRTQQPSELMCLVLRTAPGMTHMGAALRAAIRDVDPTLPPMHLTTVDRIVTESVADRRFYTAATVAFAALAVLLTAIALVIVIGRAAVERRRELAIRAAVGAPVNHLIALVARQTVVPVLGGVAVGLLTAWFGASVLQQFLFEMEPRDPLVYGLACALTITVAGVSSLLPARRVGQVSPAVVLRGE